MPPLHTAPAQSTELPQTDVTPQEIQTCGSEVAKLDAGDNGNMQESDRVSGRLGEEAGGPAVVAEGHHSSKSVVTPPQPSSAGDVAAPSAVSAAPEQKVGGGSAHTLLSFWWCGARGPLLTACDFV